MDKQSKKEIRNKYKLTPPQPGIYMITCTANNKRFIGAAMNVRGKLNGHEFSLVAGGHIHKELQMDYQQFGAVSFEFEILEKLKQREDLQFDYSDELKEREAFWLSHYQPYGDKGYNKLKEI